MSKLCFSIIFFLGMIIDSQQVWSRDLTDNPCKEARMLVETIQEFHISPRPIDDALSEVVFQHLIDQLDRDRLFLCKEDIAHLNQYRQSIDNDILNQECRFVSQLAELYARRIAFADSVLNTFLGEAFDFGKADSICMGSEIPFFEEAQLSERWRKYVKFQILSSYFNQTASPPTDLSEISLGSVQEKEIEQEICRIYSRMNYKGGIEQYIGERFLESLTFAFDPHSVFQPGNQTEQFDSRLFAELYDYGFDVDRNESGKIEVKEIIPGSPAWYAQSFHEGDVILTIKTAEGEIAGFDCLSMQEVYDFLSSTEILEASFHIQKQDGKELQVLLEKTRYQMGNHIIRSYTLEGNATIGYVSLPSFYAAEGSAAMSSKGAAEDVARQLIQLRHQQVDGLIFDLRNNGGGRLDEAIRLAGFFIDHGAISIMDSRLRGVQTLKDRERGTVFDAPMVILVNSFSASASELFAAAMQDHNRAIVVGTRTMGKSTSQISLPITTYKRNEENPSEGSLRLTTGYIYRVTGETHQKVGVQPDILLPNVFDGVELGEKRFSTALDLPAMDKKTYYFPKDSLPLQALRFKSEERTLNSSVFSRIKQLSSAFSELSQQEFFPISYDDFQKMASGNPWITGEWDLNMPDEQWTMVSLTGQPNYEQELTSSQIENVNITKEEIIQDPYIKEAYEILKDFIQISKQ